MRSRTWRGLVYIATSLDGFIARPDGDIDWLTDPPDDSGHAPARPGPQPAPDYDTFMLDVDHHVIGRGTYEKVLTFGAWPYTDTRVVVLSSTMDPDVDDRITVAGDLDVVLALLTRRAAAGVYVDGGKVIQTFLRHGLIDEMTITTAPVLLGEGLQLFGALPGDVRLTLLGTSVLAGGMVSSRYRVLHGGRFADPFRLP